MALDTQSFEICFVLIAVFRVFAFVGLDLREFRMNADSLSREEALELFFSLPDESDTSEGEAESSDDEFVPELAPRDSSGDEDEPGPSTGKRNT